MGRPSLAGGGETGGVLSRGILPQPMLHSTVKPMCHERSARRHPWRAVWTRTSLKSGPSLGPIGHRISLLLDIVACLGSTQPAMFERTDRRPWAPAGRSEPVEFHLNRAMHRL